jgi:hypothetical protein
MTTIEITIGHETRAIDISDTPARTLTTGRIYLDGLTVATIGQGTARYPACLMLWTGDRASNRVTDSDGNHWSYNLTDTIRNRQARIVAWADVAPATNYNTQEKA